MDRENADLRRYEEDLNGSGTGVIIMGIWSIIRVLIEVFIFTKDDEFAQEDAPVRIILILLMLLLIGAVAFVVMKIHMYIGLNAIRAARGKEYKKGYYKATIIYFIFSILALVTYKDDLETTKNLDTTIAAFIVDLTTIYLLGCIIRSTAKIRKLAAGTQE